MTKVMTVVGTRPELIRLSEVIKRLDEDFHHVLVHTGQNYDYELSEVFYHDLGIRTPNYFLNTATGNAMSTIAGIISKVDDLIERERPDAFLILGDTNSCLSGIVAKRRKVPLFHYEAGNRCFDERVPEEINRRIIDHIADVNLTYSQISKNYLLSEGLNPQRTICVGSPMREVILAQREKIENSQILKSLKLSENAYILASIHREENVSNIGNFQSIFETLNKLASNMNLPVVVSTHPRTRNALNQLNLTLDSRILLAKPFSFSDYCKLQKESYVVLSDSGTITEESAILGFPALNIRETHERPEGDEVATLIMTSFEFESVMESIQIIKKHWNGKDKYSPVKDYGPENVSYVISRLIKSFISKVNRDVWRK